MKIQIEIKKCSKCDSPVPIIWTTTHPYCQQCGKFVEVKR